MDRLFNSRLQTKLQKIGVTGDFKPPETQDPANKVLHEYFIAETARSLFDKRRKVALDALKNLDDKKIIAKALQQAIDHGVVGVTSLFDAPDYTCTLHLKSPTERFDKTVARNELVKLGVDIAKIDKAFSVATSKNKPAETYVVTPVLT